MKKTLSLILTIVVISVSFIICSLEIYAGTDPEPLWLFPTDDATIKKGNPDDNFDYDGSSSIDEGGIGYHLAKSGYMLIYMKFDLSNVNVNEIDNAKLRIFACDDRQNNNDYIYIYEVDDTDWSETSINWSNAPVTDFTGTEYIKEIKLLRSTNFNLYYIDIKEYIIEKVNEGKNEITMAFNGNTQYFKLSIHSKDLVGTPDGNHGSTAPCIIINEDIIPPSIPQNLTAEAVSTEEIQLTWDAATDNVAVSGYEIYKDNEKVAFVNDAVCSINGLQPSSVYSFYVKAVDSSGNLSDPSETVSKMTFHLPDENPPSVPQSLNALVLSNTMVRLTWEPSEDNMGVNGYSVFCDGDEIATVGADGYLGYVVTGLSSGTEFTFSVEAFDIVGNRSGTSDGVTVTTLSNPDKQPPEKPANLQLDIPSTYSSQATLTWAPSPDVDTKGYVVYANESEKARVESTTSYQFTDLTPYTEYNIYVKAFDYSGNLSEASVPLTFTTTFERMLTVGTEEENDYSTIQSAVNAANPGDVVLIRSGTYNETVVVSKSGTVDKWITILAEEEGVQNNGAITVNADYIRLSGIKLDGGGSVGGVTVKGSNVQVTNLDMENVTAAFYLPASASNVYIADNYAYRCQYGAISHGDNVIIERNEIEYLCMYGPDDSDYFRIWGENVIIRGNYCHGTVPGDHLKFGNKSAHVDFVQSFDATNEKSKNILIENNIVTGFFDQGVMFNNNSFGKQGIYSIENWTIRNNIISGFSSWGVCAGYLDHGGVPNVVVENNLIIGDPSGPGPYGAWHGVIFRGTGTYGVIRNNIIMNCGSNGTSYGKMGAAVINDAGNNLIYNADTPGVIASTDIIGIDPCFVDPVNNDFHLLPNSPAIDMGAEVSFRYDLDGKLRPNGMGFDIGAYEFYGVKANTPPIVTVTSPSANSAYTVGSTVDISVSTKDDQYVVKVEYYLNGEKIGESIEAPFSFMIENIQENIHTLYAVAYDDEGLYSKSNEVIFISSDSEVMNIGSSWVNLSIPKLQGIAVVSFNAIPMIDDMNGVIGVTSGSADDFPELAAIVRFNSDGLVDAYRGGAYDYDNEVHYNAFKRYRFTMIINIPQRLYSVFIANDEGDTHLVAENYPFRTTGAVGADTLDTIACLAEMGSYILFPDIDEIVYVPGESIELEDSIINMQAGSTRTLTATVLPEEATIKFLKWESSDTSIATVDGNGKVTAISEGTALITARITGTTLQDNCIVTVTDKQEENLPPEFDPIEQKSVNVGSTLEFTVNATDPEEDQLTYSAINLPNGAAFDGQTFSWIPEETQKGTYQVTFAVTDGVNPSVEITVNITVNQVEGEYAFTIEDVSIDKGAGIAVEATITANTSGGGNAVVIFKLMKKDGTVIGLTSSELYIEDDSVFKVKFHGYSGDEYKVKIYVWDRLDRSTENIGENLAEPVEIQ